MALREECILKAGICFPVVSQVEGAAMKTVGWRGQSEIALHSFIWLVSGL